jgi:hypothetical protein
MRMREEEVVVTGDSSGSSTSSSKLQSWVQSPARIAHCSTCPWTRSNQTSGGSGPGPL